MRDIKKNVSDNINKNSSRKVIDSTFAVLKPKYDIKIKTDYMNEHNLKSKQLIKIIQN